MQQLTFKRAAAQLWADGVLIGLAYSGNGAGLNNPDMDGVHDVGCLPAGLYHGVLAPDITHKGPRVWRLNADPSTDLKGRSGFLCHWDTPQQNFLASDGCIVPVMSITFSRIQDTFELEVV